MYHKEKSIQIKNSASALYNNLGVLRIAPRSLTYFTVVHANVVNMVSASWDGLNYSHRQLQSKEPNVATSTSLIMQAAFCALPSRDLLVVTSQKGIQIYESDGSTMVYWHALDTPDTPTGDSSGSILVFDVPSKGSNITLSDVLKGHKKSITDIASECSGSQLLSAAEDSLVRVWHLSIKPESLSVEVAHLHNECVTDTQICGAKFCDGDGYAFAVTGYDLSEIIRYSQS
ncbi:hypothetical protein F7725_012735 [Dissostichus mawsoni]|uniref:WD repeat-containing protein 54 beta-propeller domain-containing protein n=1 Tax=Dissostichus mawsoni TaxID=36200 RepID=A0A7J5YPA4_DISMA|nr:hypothetical protein F7725_012735 [Dissostichus mawsoni]